jgi:class 3 adenylate cyclase
VSTEQRQIEATIAGLEAQRPHLGDALVDAALAPLRQRLDRAERRGRRRTRTPVIAPVSVLFMDVVGSTTLSRRLDPEDIHAVMDGLLARCTAQVEAHGGKVLQYAGDSLLAAFGAERSREDDAERAVRAGLALLDEARAKARRSSSASVTAASGSGSACTPARCCSRRCRCRRQHPRHHRQRRRPHGTERAARRLRISDDTFRLVRGAFETERQAPIEVKGLGQPVVTHLVRRARPSRDRRPARGIEGSRRGWSAAMPSSASCSARSSASTAIAPASSSR